VKITKDLYWVGANDHRLSLFENIHPLYHGVSYNAYVLLDQQTVLFDTADWSVGRQFLDNVTAALGGRTLDYLIINHVEPDHAASIQEILLRWPKVKILTTPKAVILLHQFGFDLGEHVEEVHEGDSRCFGSHTIAFVNAPMVHWPEAMVSFDTTAASSSPPTPSAPSGLWTASSSPTSSTLTGSGWTTPAGTTPILWASTAPRSRCC
jgi:anaerobic nitric oxide reductase flavorubredoxin